MKFIVLKKMRHFRLIKERIDTSTFINELMQFEGEWGDKRSQNIWAQRETKDIALRNGVTEIGKSFEDCHKSYKTENYSKFPKLTKFLEDFALENKAELSRVLIVNLSGGGKVYPHVDNGEYYAVRDRYHFVLISSGGEMHIGDEVAIFNTGELWWYDNKTIHHSLNNSGDLRVHVIFDLLPLSRMDRLRKLIGLKPNKFSSIV